MSSRDDLSANELQLGQTTSMLRKESAAPFLSELRKERHLPEIYHIYQHPHKIRLCSKKYKTTA